MRHVPLSWLVLLTLLSLSAPMVQGSSVTEAVARKTDSEKVCVRKVCFPRMVISDGTELHVRGATTAKYWGFSLYGIAFYMPPAVASDQWAGDHAKRMAVHYHRGFTKAQLSESTEKIVANNPASDMEALRKPLDALYAAYQDVKKGDEYVITYTPGKGTVLVLNGVESPVIEGEDFAAALFGVWVSDYGISTDLSKTLLGRNK